MDDLCDIVGLPHWLTPPQLSAITQLYWLGH